MGYAEATGELWTAQRPAGRPIDGEGAIEVVRESPEKPETPGSGGAPRGGQGVSATHPPSRVPRGTSMPSSGRYCQGQSARLPTGLWPVLTPLGGTGRQSLFHVLQHLPP